MKAGNTTIKWLMEIDPSVRWQVMRDLLGEPEPTWRAERAKVETEGWGARLLSYRDEDGQWAGGAFAPRDFDWSQWKSLGQPWTATGFAITQLREFGLDPESDSARRMTTLVGDNCRWEEGGQPFWQGEVEECINGRTLADGIYFGADVSPIVEKLLDAIQVDGGWNCRRAEGSARSSFASTINVLEGILEYEIANGGSEDVKKARRTGEAFLLDRHLFRRLSTGATADESFFIPIYPHRWKYDILRALDYFRKASSLSSSLPDRRLGEAVDLLRSRQQAGGYWLTETRLPGRVWFHLDEGPGFPSPWITLKALRVLEWWESSAEMSSATGTV
ncbi:squalene cyclase [Phyllobacterium endophyticum]|uniref:Squalene cyclase n=1 Tax=Phyllobacterium endophyticum TaxID=1149773 RepID=A0A2P7AS49_9HYPH|nr:squalene cyclase [Phyllobacterium endophyticum]MBB3236716.1 hypothetical protein [Phyllobacterium endophyticum]PSH57003.1 squalene cyclase [Phyllobacterium endophyticum]TYR39692.1 squalene cyclase [Phyllobacterium endophyticum]